MIRPASSIRKSEDPSISCRSGSSTLDSGKDDEPGAPIQPCPTASVYFAVSSLGAAIFVIALNDGLISTSNAPLAHQFNATALQVFWNGTAYLLCTAIFQPIFVHFSLFLGRKALIVAALTLYLIGTTLGMTAQHIGQVIGGRGLQGVGAGGTIVMTELLMMEWIPRRRRGLWLGITNGAFALGSATGPILGGLIVEKTEWQWLFYIDLPFLVIVLVAVPLFLNERQAHQEASPTFNLSNVDWIGTAIFVPAVSLCITPLTFGGVLFPWASGETLGCFFAGLLSLAGFVLHENHRTSYRLVDFRIFKSRTINLTFATVPLFYVAFGSQLYYIPLYLQSVQSFRPLLSGVAFLPFTGVFDITAILIGILITTTAHYRRLNWAGFVFLTLGLGLSTLPSQSASAQPVPARWILPLLISALGAGTLITSLRLTLQAALSVSDTSNAVALYSFLRDVGMTLGVALGGSVFQTALARTLDAALVVFQRNRADQIAQDAASLIPLSASFPNPYERQVVTGAYAVGFRTVGAVMCAFAGVGLVVSLFIPSLDLNRTRDVTGRREGVEGAIGLADKKKKKSEGEDKRGENADKKKEAAAEGAFHVEVTRPEPVLHSTRSIDLAELVALRGAGLEVQAFV